MLLAVKGLESCHSFVIIPDEGHSMSFGCSVSKNRFNPSSFLRKNYF